MRTFRLSSLSSLPRQLAPARLFAGLALLVAALAAIPTLLFSSTAAVAQAAPAAGKAVTIELVQKKIVKGPDGKERALDAGAVMPGDVIEYRAIYRNASKGMVRGLTASLPIPSGLAYVARSASPAGATFATSGSAVPSSFAREPLMRTSTDGKATPVPYNEYRILHWSVAQLAPGATFVVSARARVEVVIPRSPAAAGRTPQGPPAVAGHN